MDLDEAVPAVRSAETSATPAPVSIVIHRTSGTTESASGVNLVEIPNEITRKVMAETDAGKNIVHCKDNADLFRRLGI